MVMRIGIIINCAIILFFTGCFNNTIPYQKSISDQNDIYIFVQLTDNHLGYYPKGVETTEKLINEINQYKPQRPIDFIAITGDLISDGKYSIVLDDYKFIQKKVFIQYTL